MFTNKKLIIGVFLGSLAVITVVHSALLSSGKTAAFAGQVLGDPKILQGVSFPTETFSSSDASAPKDPGTTDETAGEPATGIVSDGGDVFDGCKDYEKIFPRDDYKSIPEGMTLVDGVWNPTYKRESDAIVEAAFPKNGTESTGESCKKKEWGMIADLIRLMKKYECALSEEAKDTFVQGGRVLAEQRLAKKNDEPLTVTDLLSYSLTEARHIEQAMNGLKTTREQILSPAYGRCPSEKEAQTDAWIKMSKVLDDMSALITQMNEERRQSSSEGGGGNDVLHESPPQEFPQLPQAEPESAPASDQGDTGGQ